MKKLFLFFYLLLVATVFSFAQQKYALVIGNEAYQHTTPLKNPVNDANDVAAELRELGWNVEILLNTTQEQIDNAVIRLKTHLLTSKTSYGFFFYAGHAVQSNGENFLLPIDANIQSESFLRSRSVSAQAIIDELSTAGNELNIMVLDACRNNPFGWNRSGTRGLTIFSLQPADSIIVFATSAGAVASDGTGRNGLFTSHFLPNLRTPGLEVTEVFRRTMGDVARDSNNQQRPAVYNQFSGLAYLGSQPVEPPNITVHPVYTPTFQTLGLFDTPVRNLINELSKLPAGSRIAVLFFSSESSNFSNIIRDNIKALVIQNGRIILVDDRQLNQVWSVEVSIETCASYAKQIGAQYFIIGNVSDVSYIYRIGFRIYESNTAIIKTNVIYNVQKNNQTTTILER